MSAATQLTASLKSKTPLPAVPPFPLAPQKLHNPHLFIKTASK